MADQGAKKGKGKGSGARTTVLAALLAVVAAVAIWLSDCIPGFGIGAGTKDGEREQAEDSEPAKPAEPEVEPEAEPEVEPKPMKLTVGVRGCEVDGGEPFDCATLCEKAELFEGVEEVVIDATQGPHATVVDVLDCLKSKNLAAAITRE